MTTKREYLEADAKYHAEAEPAIEELLSETFRSSALPNAIAMAGVIALGFLLCLGALIAVAGS